MVASLRCEKAVPAGKSGLPRNLHRAGYPSLPWNSSTGRPSLTQALYTYRKRPRQTPPYQSASVTTQCCIASLTTPKLRTSAVKIKSAGLLLEANDPKTDQMVCHSGELHVNRKTSPLQILIIFSRMAPARGRPLPVSTMQTKNAKIPIK